LKPRRAFLDVEDAVRGFYLAATKGKPGEAYNLCGVTTHKISELLRTTMRLSAVKAEIRQADHLMRPSDEKIIFGSTAKIRKHTGWEPTRSLEQTLRAMFNYWNRVL
jgi:GDP-4-dehydro-6-deoxy-D-mannose reductase